MRKRFHQYCLTKQIANTSSGSVYLAHHVSNEPHKVLLEILDAACFTFTQQDEDVFQKIKKIQQLKHASIVPIMDLGIEQGLPYVVREYHTCEALCHRLDRLYPQRLNWQEALTIIRQVGQVLSCAHQYQILHGNIKPETIFLKSNGEVLLSDFGLADFIDVTKPSQKADLRTISYLAPEQLVGSLTEKSDQYSLACLAYELITGYVPFSAQSTFSVIAPPPVKHVPGKAIKRGERGNGDQVMLGQTGSLCENSQCPDYGKAGKNNVRKYGKTRQGAQRWQCKTCQATWSSSSMWTKNHLEFLIPLSDLVPDLPRPIQEAVLKAMAKDPADRYADVSIFLRTLEIASLLPTSPRAELLVVPPATTLTKSITEPLQEIESEAPLTTHNLKHWKFAQNGYHTSKAIATPEIDIYLSSKDQMMPLGNSHVEALPKERLPQPPILWLAFALSGIVILLGTLILYAFVPSHPPTNQPIMRNTPTPVVLKKSTPMSQGQTSLTGSYAEQNNQIYNLTSEGKLDWIDWGLNGPEDVNHKLGVQQQINTFNIIGNDNSNKSGTASLNIGNNNGYDPGGYGNNGYDPGGYGNNGYGPGGYGNNGYGPGGYGNNGYDPNSSNRYFTPNGYGSSASNNIGKGGVQRASYASNAKLWWSDGTPVMAAQPQQASGVYVPGINNGFTFNVPASTIPRTLRVYLGVNGARGEFTASLNGKAYIDETLNAAYDPKGPQATGIYTLVFNSTVPDQALTVTYTAITTDGSNGYAMLQAATLH